MKLGVNTAIRKRVACRHAILLYNDTIKSRWTARHTFSSRLASSTGLDGVLNIGSYNGWLEPSLISSGRRSVVGIDVNQGNIRQAKQAVPQADFVVASAVALPFRARIFRLITMFEVIEHLAKGTEKTCMDECNRVLHSGGILLLSTPSSTVRSKLLDPAWYLGHRHYSASSLAFIGRKAGFTLRNTFMRGGVFEQLTMILLYIFKLFKLEVPFKPWFERHRQSEYEGKGFSTLFMMFGKYREYV